ncbi:hypothetical protein FBZ89_114124 [Nitrospirillum amazonense]|uniref:Uncharacterized protein n=2 Tax=Nitrospirillum amazonense TaxID=28077 RepID=A0A560F1M8_9PROT|nr:hypothetical protein FBZ89_114124 [Nitrospirillum amazonense]
MAQAAPVADTIIYDQYQTDYEVNLDKDDRKHFNTARTTCMTGLSAEVWEKPGDKHPMDNGMYCLRLLEKSADVQRLPQDAQDLHDRGVLGVYENILAGKGLNPSASNARRLVEVIDTLSQNPAVRDSTGTVTFQLSDAPNVPFHSFPSVTIDAAFSKTVLNALQTGKMPTPSNMSEAALNDMTRACYRNAATNGACHDAGVAQAGNYLRKAKTAMGY